MIEEYKKNGYVIFDDLLPEEEYKKYLTFVKILRIIRYHKKGRIGMPYGKHLMTNSFQIQTKFMKINFGELMRWFKQTN